MSYTLLLGFIIAFVPITFIKIIEHILNFYGYTFYYNNGIFRGIKYRDNKINSWLRIFGNLQEIEAYCFVVGIFLIILGFLKYVVCMLP